MKSIKLSDYFQVVKPNYVYLKLTPTNSIRNYDSDRIAKVVSSLYRNITNRIKRHNKKYFFEAPSKVAYYIYIEKGKAEFYFVVPENHLRLIKEKIGDTWKGITITQVADMPQFTDKAVKYQLTYTKEDALSLAIDKRTNTLLSSVLNVIDVLEEGDRVGVCYNFVPTAQRPWQAEYKRTMEKVELGNPIDKEKKSLVYAFKIALVFGLYLANTFLAVSGSIFGHQAKDMQLRLDSMRPQITNATLKKKHAQVIKTQIVVAAESPDKNRALNASYSVCEAFRTISADNELTYKPHKGKLDMEKLYLPGVEPITTAAEECQNFIALPGRELLEEHNCIEKIDTYESEVPEELRTGVMCIGDNTYRGRQQKAYISSDKEYKNLSLVIIGPARAGKSTLISNISKDAIEHGECTILFDFISNCELSDEVAEVFPKEKVLVIDCEKTLQGLGYNEVKPETDTFKRYRNAKTQTSQLLTLINSINAADKELSAKMDRFLESAALIVFINNGPIKDVFAALQNHLVRAEYISRIPIEQKENLEEYVLNLRELDEVDKKEGEVVGTRLNAISGVIDRINKLKQNTYMELMLKKDCSDNIDLVQEIQKNQLICLRMPEIMFTTQEERDIYCTYWITKFWLAFQIRKWEMPERSQHTKVNLVVDELYQTPHLQDFVRSKLSQMPKFTGKMIISCHYLNQISIIRDELRSANSSYMLISGCDKQNFRELAEELQPYQVEDLLNLKRYHSLNLIKCNSGYARFITHLPRPIKKEESVC